MALNDAKNLFFLACSRLLVWIWFLICIATFQTAGATAKPAPADTAPANNTVGSPAATATTATTNTVTTTTKRWTCNAFYLPARNIWQRTVAIEYEGDVVRSVQIDALAVYTFTVEGSNLLTSVDGERIQFDVAELSWTSDLRSLASSTGRCTL